ncbi:MAG: hypothetical protein V3T64_05750 [Myxococcota bacterium]
MPLRMEAFRRLLASLRRQPIRLALVGHSKGGFAALISGAEPREVSC